MERNLTCGLVFFFSFFCVIGVIGGVKKKKKSELI